MPGRLRLRPPGDPLGPRHRGAGPSARARHAASSESRCRTPIPPSSTCSPRSCAVRWPRSRHERVTARPHRRRSRVAELPRLPEGAAHPEGRLRVARAPRRAGGAGAARRVALGRAGWRRRPRRPQRLRQDDAPEDRLRDHQADVGPSRGHGPDRVAPRARRRLPPGFHRPRERLPQRLDPRPFPGSRARGDGRDRGVRRARAVHRPAGAHVLVGDVHAPRLLGRRAHPVGRAAARRGVRRRRRAVSAQVLRQDRRVQEPRRHDPLRLTRRAGRRAAVRPRRAPAPGRGRLRRPDARGDRRLPAAARRRREPGGARGRAARVGQR